LAVAVEDEDVCKALLEEKCATSILKLFESENQELVHRALVMVGGFASVGGRDAIKHLMEHNMLPAIAVISKMVPTLKVLAAKTGQTIEDLAKEFF